jgi:ribosomal protein L3
MVIKGQIKAVKETVQVTDSFKKREFVITTNEDKYPQDILFQLSQDKVSLLDTIQVNELVEVDFNLRGRGFEKDGVTKYFNSLEAWKINKI